MTYLSTVKFDDDRIWCRLASSSLSSDRSSSLWRSLKRKTNNYDQTFIALLLLRINCADVWFVDIVVVAAVAIVHVKICQGRNSLFLKTLYCLKIVVANSENSIHYHKHMQDRFLINTMAIKDDGKLIVRPRAHKRPRECIMYAFAHYQR